VDENPVHPWTSLLEGVAVESRLGYNVLCGGCPSFSAPGQPLLRQLGLLRTHDIRHGQGVRSRLEVEAALAMCLSSVTMTGFGLLLWDLGLILVGSSVVLCCLCVVGLVFRGVLRNV
jgi:hypothetical protein